MTNVAKTIKYLAMALAIFLAISIISTLCYGVVLLGNVVSNDNSNINDKDNIRIENSVQLTSLEIMKEMDIDVKRINIYIKYDDNFGVSTTNKYIKGRIQDNKLYIYEVDHSVIEKYEGDLYIFIPFGSLEVEHLEDGEIIYASGDEVKTRRWTWRQGENSKVDETIKNAFIPLDGFTENKENILKLQEEFSNILTNMGVECTLGFIDKDHNTFTF